ncbi:choice-of-anchor tandem repeat GloVer-containing protein [Ideonella sp. DXS29W]|uniref:Choice-of-anchor tandem repeat GloVer-containing protein n=1 Tax=Ideonella lacteola TaxID=2984193 RepID=A0ABU9BH21_9BURK
MISTIRSLAAVATALACGLVQAQTSLAAPAWQTAGTAFKLLHEFEGAPLSGRPNAALILGPDGNFYGTSSDGGDDASCRPFGCGTIYRMKPNGVTKMLHSFKFASDGQFPLASLMLASDGKFYGTAYYGGPLNGGTLFRTDTKGNFEVLYAFKHGGPNGAHPTAAVVEGPDGMLYGTTQEGGVGQAPLCLSNGISGCGTVFNYSIKSGVLRVLRSFAGQDGDGAFPSEPLTLANDGNFYGTTSQGGASQYGTLFRMTKDGEFTLLHVFDLATGATPSGTLVQGRDGALYGTTARGGLHGGGTVFRITLDGAYSLVHEFDPVNEGDTPDGKLVLGPGDLLYGVLRYGGDKVSCNPAGCGSAYSLSATGKYRTLHKFNGTDGIFPSGGLTRLGDTKLLGTTEFGGSADAGVIFTIKP